jgi:hypothetical protein
MTNVVRVASPVQHRITFRSTEATKQAGVQEYSFHAAHRSDRFLYINKKFWEELNAYVPMI